MQTLNSRSSPPVSKFKEKFERLTKLKKNNNNLESTSSKCREIAEIKPSNMSETQGIKGDGVRSV